MDVVPVGIFVEIEEVSSPDQVEQVYTRDERISNVVVGWTRTIDVRVSWDEENRPNRSVTLSSIRFNRTGL